MQPRQSAWHRGAVMRAPGTPADGGAVRTGCESAPLQRSARTHVDTRAALPAVVPRAIGQAGSTPTPLVDGLIIAARAGSC